MLDDTSNITPWEQWHPYCSLMVTLDVAQHIGHYLYVIQATLYHEPLFKLSKQFNSSLYTFSEVAAYNTDSYHDDK